jgi:hypothetical protein
MTKKLSKFSVEINKGPTQTIETRTGLYYLAAAAALAQLEYYATEEGADIVKIWVPDLLPDYGPYFYAWDGHKIFNMIEGLNKQFIW